MVARLSLLDGRVKRHNKEHLPRVLVREQEQTQHRRHRDLVVERFTVQLEERLEHFDVVATTGMEMLYHA